MLVSAKLNLVYVEPPKTGTSTCRHVLQRLDPKIQRPGKIHQTTWDPSLDGYRVAVSIRNPYARAVSYWAYMRDKRLDHTASPGRWEEQRLAQRLAFPEFIREAQERLAKISIAAISRPAPRVDFWWRVEQLEQDLRQTLSLPGSVRIPRRNSSRSGGPAWWQLYTPAAVEFIRELWADDFRLLAAHYSDKLEDAISS